MVYSRPMRCFIHGDVEAVGTCKSCQRGLCRECATEVGTSLACRDRCESDVRDYSRMVAWSIKATESPPPQIPSFNRTFRSASLLNMVLGVAFAAWGFLSEPRMWFLVIIGFAMFTFGLFEMQKPPPAKPKDNQEPP